jgi:hypothetical protein
MKKVTLTLTLALVGLTTWSTSQAQSSAEVVANLLSTIARQSNGSTNDVFQVSFGSLNGGLESLLTKPASADGAAGFAAWYQSNSRTFLNWGSVTGSSITDSDAFYRYYGEDTSVGTRVAGPLTSIWSATLSNRALAFVSYSDSTYGIEEIGLYDLGFFWTSPSDPIAVAFGLSENWTLSAEQVTSIYGAADANASTYGALTTSTVPEPSSASLMLLGAAGVFALRRLRKNNV